MEGSPYSSFVLVCVLSVFISNVSCQVGGTPSTAAMITQPPSEPSSVSTPQPAHPDQNAVSSESLLHTTLANVTSLPISTPANQDVSLASISAIAGNVAISTSSMSPPPQSGERIDITEGVIVLVDATSVPDVSVTTSVISPVSSSSIVSTTPPPASATVAPVPIPQLTTAPPQNVVSITASAADVPTQPLLISSHTTPVSVTATSPSSNATKEPIRGDRENDPVEYDIETDVNETTLLMINYTAKPEDEATESSSDFDVESMATINDETEVPSTSITFTTDDRSAIDSLVQAACEKERRIDTVVVLGVVVIVNVVSVVVTALCVYRVVKRHLSWDPPPLAFPKGDNHRSGVDLASDADCKSGECGGTNIPIIITNEDGWCVPYTENEVKKTKNKIEDTGV